MPLYVILGSGGQGRDVLDALLAAGREVAGVFDDGTPPLPDHVPTPRPDGVTVAGNPARLIEPRQPA